MKAFWSVLALVAIVTLALFLARGRAARSSAESERESAAAEAADPIAQNAQRLADETSRLLDAQSAHAPAGVPRVEVAPPTPSPAPAPPGTGAQDHPLDQTGADLNAALFGDSTVASSPAPSAAAKAAAEAPHPTQPPGAGAPSAANARNAPAKIQTRADGSMLVDDRFIIRGSGTRDAPYEITWEYLTSAQETYQPRLGLKNIPDRLNIVHNKYVTISGYVAFPVLAASADEMLMMLNQWDGCCIGVPPTPYDAIEVKLSTPASREQRLAIDGSVSGLLKVDPYLVKDWLVSMYIMDDARIVKDSSGGPNKKVRVPGAHAGTGSPNGADPAQPGPAVDPLNQP